MSFDLPSNPIVITPRLRLRALKASDLAAYHKLRGNAQVMLYSLTHKPDINEEATWSKLSRAVIENRSSTVSEDESSNYGLGVEILPESDLAASGEYEPGVVYGDMIIIGFSKAEEAASSKYAFEAEFGYMFAPSLWGKGVATEAMSAFVRHWDELQATWGWKTPRPVMLKATVEEPNVASYKALRKCGFTERKRWTEENSGDKLIEMVFDPE